MRMTPDGTKWWIAGMEGEVVEVSNTRPLSLCIVVELDTILSVVVRQLPSSPGLAWKCLFPRCLGFDSTCVALRRQVQAGAMSHTSVIP